MDLSKASEQVLQGTETSKIIILYIGKKGTSYLRPRVPYWHLFLTERETIALLELKKLKKI